MIFCQYIFPSILCPQKLNSTRIILGNALIASLPFLAITYLPITVLLFFSAFRIEIFKKITIGVVIGLLSNLLFLSIYGSFKGFLAFHIYLNSQVLPLYSKGTFFHLITNVIYTITHDFIGILSIIIIIVSMRTLIQGERFPWRGFLIILGLLSLLIRIKGFHFHNLPYFYALLSFSVLLIKNINMNYIRLYEYVVIFFLLIFCVFRVSLLFPEEEKKYLSETVPIESEFSRLVDIFTESTDKIIAYSFKNTEYIISKRLPASGHFFYLPWQEKYNENPKLGIIIDACSQIKESKPKVMLIDKQKVWERYDWESYAGCIQNIIDADYIQVPGRNYYIQKDFIKDYNYSNNDILRMIEGKSFYLTDKNWVNGVSREYAGFFVPNTPRFKAQYIPGRLVQFGNGETREILSVFSNGIYLNIRVDGSIIESNAVGYPNQFKVFP